MNSKQPEVKRRQTNKKEKKKQIFKIHHNHKLVEIKSLVNLENRLKQIRNAGQCASFVKRERKKRTKKYISMTAKIIAVPSVHLRGQRNSN